MKHGFIGDPDQGPQMQTDPDASAPGETAANEGDFIGDTELKGGKIDTSSEEEVEDTTSLIGDDENSTDEEVEVDDNSDDDTGETAEVEEVEFSISQIMRAGQAGITESQLTQYGSEQELESAILSQTALRSQQVPAQQAPQPAPAPEVEAWEPEPFTEAPPTDLMDENAMRDYLVRMNEHHAQQLAEARNHANPEVMQQVQALQQNLQQQNNRQLFDQCEKQFDKMVDFEELIGKGSTLSMAPGTKALTNRQAVIVEMQKQQQVHPELSFEQLFDAAFQYALRPSLEATATKKVRKAVAKRQSKASPKPSTRSGAKGAAALPKGPERVKAMLRDTSTSLGKKAKKLFDAIK